MGGAGCVGEVVITAAAREVKAGWGVLSWFSGGRLVVIVVIVGGGGGEGRRG